MNFYYHSYRFFRNGKQSKIDKLPPLFLPIILYNFCFFQKWKDLPIKKLLLFSLFWGFYIIANAQINAGSYGPVCQGGNTITLNGSPSPGSWSGLGVVDASNADGTAFFFPPTAGTGTHSIKYTPTSPPLGFIADSTDIVVNVTPFVNTISNQSVCAGEMSTPITFTGSNGTTFIWINDNTATGLSLNGSGNIPAFTSTNSTMADIVSTITITPVDLSTFCVGQAKTFTITVGSRLNSGNLPSAGTYAAVCENASDVTLMASRTPQPMEKGKWIGMGVTDLNELDSLAFFDPSGQSGTIFLSYIFTDSSGCADTANTNILVNNIPVAATGAYIPVCTDGADVTLSGGPVPSGVARGVWAGQGVSDTDSMDANALFSPIGLSGAITLSYIFTDVNGCSSNPTTTSITVNASPILVPGTYGPVCENDAMINLSATPFNAASAWSGTNITDGVNGDGIFNPSGLSGGVSVIYTYTDANNCTGDTSITISVNDLPNSTAGTYGPICQDITLQNLVGSPSPSTNESGFWNCLDCPTNPLFPNPEVVDGNTMDAVAVFKPNGFSGTFMLEYTFTDANFCASRDTTTIIIVPSPIIILAGNPIQICEDAAAISISGTPVPVTATERGTWSGMGITDTSTTDAIASFNPAGLIGMIALTYTYLDDTGCSNSDSFLIMVADISTSTGTYDPVCEHAADVLLKGSPNPGAGDMGVWSGLGVVDASDTDSLALFDPTGLSGLITLKYKFTNSNNCVDSATTTILVTEPLTGNYGAVCEAAAEGMLIGSPVPGTNESGKWIGTGVTDVNTSDATAVFDPTGLNGTYSLKYIFENADGCKDTANTTIIVNPKPTVSTGTYTSVCESDSDVNLLGSPLPTGLATGTWSGIGVTDANSTDAIALFDPSGLSGAITIKYAFVDVNGCTDTATTTITVNNSNPNTGTYTPICEDSSSLTLIATPVPGNNETGTWSGLGVVDMNTSDEMAIFNPGGLKGNITLTYKFKNSNGCTDSATTTIFVDSLSANTGTYSDICQNAGSITLTGSPLPGTNETGTWSGTGVADNNTSDAIATFNPSGLSGSVSLIYSFQSANNCTKSDTTTINILPSAMVNASTDSLTICESDSVILKGTFSGIATGISWTGKTMANGIINILNDSSASYQPSGSIVGTSREDIIYLTGITGTTTCPAAIDSIKVQVIKQAIIDLGPDISFCENPTGTITPVSVGLENNLTWTSNNGSFNDNTASVPIYTPNLPIPTAIRSDIIIVTSRDSFGLCPAVMDTLIVNVFEITSITEGDTSTVCEGDSVIINNNFTGNIAAFTTQISGNNGAVVANNFQLFYIPIENTGIGTRTDTVIIINSDKDSTGICTAFSDTMLVGVLHAPKADLVVDTTICAGETINLLIENFGLQDTFKSSFSTSLLTYPSSSLNLNSGILKDTVIFGTRLVNNACPAAIDSVIVTISPLDTIDLSLLDTTICESNPVVLNSGITDTTISHSWIAFNNKGTFDDSTSTTPTYIPTMGLTTASRIDTIILNVVVDSNRCKTGKDTLFVTILQAGSFTTIADTTICTGDSLSLNVTTTGSIAQFSWTSNNGSFTNTTNPVSKYIPSVLTTEIRVDTIIARLTFTNSICPAISDTTMVNVLGVVEVNAGIDTTICQGTSYQLAGTFGSTATSATWSVLNAAGIFNNTTQLNAIYTPNGGLTNSNRVDTLLLTTNDPDGTGNCVSGVDRVLITVTPTPTVSLGQDTTIFNGQSLVINASLSDAVLTSRWTSNNGSIPSSTLDKATYLPNDLGTATSRLDKITYQGELLNGSCPNITDSLLITVIPVPGISNVVDEAFCKSLCIDTATLKIDVNTGNLVVLANNIDPTDTCVGSLGFDYKFWSTALGTPVPSTIMDLPGLPSSLTFDCDDKGAQNVNVYVIDDAMNVAFCPAVINVEDPSTACGERTISGKITTFKGEPAVGFVVFIEDPNEVGSVVPNPDTTDENGQYEFVLKTGRAFRIAPKRDINHGEGVTAFDEVMIKRHILDIEGFTSPYQSIASDVNKTGIETALDLLLIHRVILKKEDKFPNNTSWRFVLADFVFDNIENAAAASFPETFLVTETMGNVENVDFIAVKIGDPNASASFTNTYSAEPRNGIDNIVFKTKDLQLEKGKIYDIPFHLLNSQKVLSYQFTLNFDGLKLLEIKKGVANKEDFGANVKGSKMITTSWSSAIPKPTNQQWFSLKFKASKNGNLSALLSISSAQTPIEGYTTENENVGINLTFEQKTPTDFILFQNKPNPFKEGTLISFTLPKTAAVQLSVMDIHGKVIRTIKGEYKEGYNEIKLDFADLPIGVFYYRLETEFGTKTQKMMHLE